MEINEVLKPVVEKLQKIRMDWIQESLTEKGLNPKLAQHPDRVWFVVPTRWGEYTEFYLDYGKPGETFLCSEYLAIKPDRVTNQPVVAHCMFTEKIDYDPATFVFPSTPLNN